MLIVVFLLILSPIIILNFLYVNEIFKLKTIKEEKIRGMLFGHIPELNLPKKYGKLRRIK